MSTITDKPKNIFLQVGPDTTDVSYSELSEVTFSTHQVFDTDIVYSLVEGEPETEIEKIFANGEIPDLSIMQEEDKAAFLNGFLKLTSEHVLKVFMMLGLKTHIEAMIVNEPTKEAFIFSFKKL